MPSDASKLDVAARRILETLHWKRSEDAQVLLTDLRCRLSRRATAKAELRLLLRPDPPSQNPRVEEWSWQQKIMLPPCRFIWAGKVLPAPPGSQTPRVEILAELLETPKVASPFVSLTLPLSVLRLVHVARILQEPGQIRTSRRSAYGGPGPAVWFWGHAFEVDFWVQCTEMAVVRPAEIPALTIATIVPYPAFAQTPLCIFADRPAHRLLIVPCWELFRYYYAECRKVARMVFAFPSWKAEMLGELLCSFDGHCFRTLLYRDVVPLVESYAAQRLEAIGRDAVLSYALTGAAQIHAVPPFREGARLVGVGQTLQLGPYHALFVQQILHSQARADGEPGVVRWKPLRASPERLDFR